MAANFSLSCAFLGVSFLDSEIFISYLIVFPNGSYNPSYMLWLDSVEKETAESNVAVKECMDAYELGARFRGERVRVKSLRSLGLLDVRIQIDDEVLSSRPELSSTG